MNTANSFSVRRLVVVILTLILMVGVTALAFFSWQLTLKPEDRLLKGLPGVEEKITPTGAVSREARIAQAENEATVAQQATMSASIEDITVPKGCEEVALYDPFLGVKSYEMVDEKTKLAHFKYEAVLTGYREEERGKCTDSILIWEHKVGGEMKQFEIRLPKEKIGSGALGSILPKVLGYKIGHRVDLKLTVNYIPEKSLRVLDWEVVQFYIKK